MEEDEEDRERERERRMEGGMGGCRGKLDGKIWHQHHLLFKTIIILIEKIN